MSVCVSSCCRWTLRGRGVEADVARRPVGRAAAGASPGAAVGLRALEGAEGGDGVAAAEKEGDADLGRGTRREGSDEGDASSGSTPEEEDDDDDGVGEAGPSWTLCEEKVQQHSTGEERVSALLETR